uniref:leucine-rich repeats and immunoglobulin-like domains protein 3 isoform X2 n=1 Tax=Ciona intestinalis TaxID=7719 RepID=UPI000EF494D2|nr:leucine-rich repeats and immunoglobulin-like domains protein 3 isoform X2 [Ciona intestinalis]|eukprot:XP_026690733.1 leucine-rich repeats and immunoglobulin-like domains protein 3 isoform X2 [Ciona intestinalis]
MLFYILIFVVLLYIDDVISSPCHEGTEKLYEHCLMQYTDMALWCDKMNLTEIPDPNHIRSPAPCESALAIYGNDSCITTITPVLFRRYSLVKLLDFSHNRIDKVEADNFENANHLRELDLSYNRIDTVEYKFEIPRLQSLNLAGNRLRHVGPIQYCKDCALRHLTLHDNVISLVKKNSFDGMNQLTSIDLRNNQLTQLSRSLFKTLCKLETLLLSGNNLHTPQPEWFATIAMNGKQQPIYEVDISNNQFRCDCQAYRYWEFLQVLHKDENDYVRSLGNSVDFVCGDSGPSFSSLTESEVISAGNCSGVDFASHSNMTSLSSFSPFKCEVIKPREVEGRRRAEETEPKLTTISHSETDYITKEIEDGNIFPVGLIVLTVSCISIVIILVMIYVRKTQQKRKMYINHRESQAEKSPLSSTSNNSRNEVISDKGEKQKEALTEKV